MTPRRFMKISLLRHRKAGSTVRADPLIFRLITDGLRAEREQGITIDVGYRYFTTARRKFIIADTPGHEQYTRNMATGASTADLAVILIDAEKGLLPQTSRHAYIASLLGIPSVVAAINKMDLVGYHRERFLTLEKEFLALAGKLGITNIRCIPISALAGRQRCRGRQANAVVRRSDPARTSGNCTGHKARNHAKYPIPRSICDPAGCELPRICGTSGWRSDSSR